jgi:hypothetical protein
VLILPDKALSYFGYFDVVEIFKVSSKSGGSKVTGPSKDRALLFSLEDDEVISPLIVEVVTPDLLTRNVRTGKQPFVIDLRH